MLRGFYKTTCAQCSQLSRVTSKHSRSSSYMGLIRSCIIRTNLIAFLLNTDGLPHFPEGWENILKSSGRPDRNLEWGRSFFLSSLQESYKKELCLKVTKLQISGSKALLTQFLCVPMSTHICLTKAKSLYIKVVRLSICVFAFLLA